MPSIKGAKVIKVVDFFYETFTRYVMLFYRGMLLSSVNVSNVKGVYVKCD